MSSPSRRTPESWLSRFSDTGDGGGRWLSPPGLADCLVVAQAVERAWQKYGSKSSGKASMSNTVRGYAELSRHSRGPHMINAACTAQSLDQPQTEFAGGYRPFVGPWCRSARVTYSRAGVRCWRRRSAQKIAKGIPAASWVPTWEAPAVPVWRPEISADYSLLASGGEPIRACIKLLADLFPGPPHAVANASCTTLAD